MGHVLCNETAQATATKGTKSSYNQYLVVTVNMSSPAPEEHVENCPELEGLINFNITKLSAVRRRQNKYLKPSDQPQRKKQRQQEPPPQKEQQGLQQSEDLAVQTLNEAELSQGLVSFELENSFTVHGKKKNTPLAYEPKVKEFKDFCDAVFPGVDYQERHILKQYNVRAFMTYQAFREQKKKGKSKKGENNKPHGSFHKDEWNRIAIGVKTGVNNENVKKVEPTNGVGWNVMNTTKASLKREWRRQRERGINNTAEEVVFDTTIDMLMCYVQERKPRQDRALFKEKVDNQSSGMDSIHKFALIEKAFFQNGITRCKKTCHSALRDRFFFLASNMGLLRGESLVKAELSDFLQVVHKGRNDPHPLFILILQIATGKTNKNGFKLYGRFARNFLVEHCPIGAMGFYFLFRFHYSGEMDDDSIDFLDSYTNPRASSSTRTSTGKQQQTTRRYIISWIQLQTTCQTKVCNRDMEHLVWS